MTEGGQPRYTGQVAHKSSQGMHRRSCSHRPMAPLLSNFLSIGPTPCSLQRLTQERRQAHHLLLPALPYERQQRPHHKVRAQDIHCHDVLEVLNVPAPDVTISWRSLPRLLCSRQAAGQLNAHERYILKRICSKAVKECCCRRVLTAL